MWVNLFLVFATLVVAGTNVLVIAAYPMVAAVPMAAVTTAAFFVALKTTFWRCSRKAVSVRLLPPIRAVVRQNDYNLRKLPPELSPTAARVAAVIRDLEDLGLEEMADHLDGESFSEATARKMRAVGLRNLRYGRNHGPVVAVSDGGEVLRMRSIRDMKRDGLFSTKTKTETKTEWPEDWPEDWPEKF